MYEIRVMTIADYDLSFELWNRTEGMALSGADSKEAINRYLDRNHGMSFICTAMNKVIGTILCGHDGRRGFIYHVAVDPEYRGQSIGKRLVERSLKRLEEEGISKCHIMVIEENETGKRFWNNTGWQLRDGILLFSSNTSVV
jgi:N-acetylglutamate synthase